MAAVLFFLCQLERSFGAQGGVPAAALLFLPADNTVVDGNLRAFLERGGARVMDSFPPGALIGYIPPALDAELAEKYGARIYRDKEADPAEFAKRGGNAVFAANIWNKRFMQEPPAAPSAASFKANREGGGGKLVLRWNEVMKADRYELEISSCQDFSSIALATPVSCAHYEVVPAFFEPGVYHWRVRALMTLNTGKKKTSGWSAPFSFAVPKPSGAAAPRLAAPSIAQSASFKAGHISWPKTAGFKYYRLQLSPAPDFSAPAVEVFTDRENLKTSGLGLERGATYYMRVMGSDGSSPGGWSGVSEIVILPPGRILNDVRRVKKPK